MQTSQPAAHRPLPLSREAFEQAFHHIDGSDRLESIRLEQLPSHGTLQLDGADLQPNQSIPAEQLDRLNFLPDPTGNASSSFRWSGHDGASWHPQALSSTIEIETIDGEAFATFSGGAEPSLPSPEIIPTCPLLASPDERRFSLAHREAFSARWPEFAQCQDFELSSLQAEYTPEWISLDPLSGQVAGQLPPVIDEASFQITAYLPDGEAKTLTLEISATVAEPKETQAMPAAPQPDFNYNARHHFPDALQAPGTRYQATLPDGTALPSWIRFDATDATFSGSPTEDDLGMITVRLSATATAAHEEDYLAIMASPSPSGPIATALTNKPAPKPAPQPKTFRHDVAPDFAAELDGATASFSITPLNGGELPEWLSFDEVTATFRGLPTIEDLGSRSFIVVATAPGRHCNRIYTIEVDADENGPFASMHVESDTAAADETWTFLYDASSLFADADLGPILVTETFLENGDTVPSWIRCNALTSELWAQPSPVLPSTLTLLVRASDGQRAAERRLHLSIEPSAEGEALFATHPIPEPRSNSEYEEFEDEPEAPSLELEYCPPEPQPASPVTPIDPLPTPIAETQLDLTPAPQPEAQTPETQDEPELASLLTLSFDGDDFMFSLHRDDETTRYNFANSSASDIPSWLIFDKNSGEFYGAPPRETLEQFHLELQATNEQLDETLAIDFTIDFQDDLRSTIVTIRRIQAPAIVPPPSIDPVEAQSIEAQPAEARIIETEAQNSEAVTQSVATQSIEAEAQVIEAVITQATVAQEAIAATESPSRSKLPQTSSSSWFRKLGYFRSGNAAPTKLQQSKKIIPPALAKRHDPVARHK